jgi:hypothetical protein
MSKAESLETSNILWYVLPPALLTPLIIIPPDYATSILWLIGGGAAFISAIKVLVSLIQKYFNRKPLQIRFIRQILTVCIFIISIISLNVSISNARSQAHSEAKKLLSQYSSKFPNTLEGWDKSIVGKVGSKKYVGWPAKFYLRYQSIEDGSGFILRLHINIDSTYIYHSSSGEILEVHHSY